MTGTTIAQAIPIAISPILTRIYTPEDFGVFALYVAFIGIFSVIASGRYELALMLPKDEDDAINIFVLGVAILLIVTITLLLLIFLFHERILALLNNQEISLWLYFIPLSVFFIGLFNLLSYYNNRLKNYKDIAHASIMKSIVLATVQLSVGFLKSGVTGLISGQIISSFFANLQLLKNILENKVLIGSVSKKKMMKLAVEYKDFPKYQAPHALLNSFSSQVPVYIFTPFFGLGVVGLYSLSTRIIFVPLMLLAGASAKVYTQQVTYLYQNAGDSYGFTVRLLKSLIKKIIAPFLLLVIFAPQIFAFVFGEAWREAGVYTQILSPWLFFNVIVSTISFIPNLVGMQKKAFIVSIVYVVLISLSLLVGVYYDSIYSALSLYTFFACMILLYNLQWMLKKLKATS